MEINTNDSSAHIPATSIPEPQTLVACCSATSVTACAATLPPQTLYTLTQLKGITPTCPDTCESPEECSKTLAAFQAECDAFQARQWYAHPSAVAAVEAVDAASATSATYVYSMDTVEARAGELEALEGVDGLFYAIKANSHPEILKTLHARGVRFEVVSPGELDLVCDLLEELGGEADHEFRILYTPNFAPKEDYLAALDKPGVLLTIDNAYVLAEWGAELAGANIMVRIDTGKGKGHHTYVQTSGIHSKFGIQVQDLGEIATLAATHGINVAGLHTHTGSGIGDTETWSENAAVLAQAAAEFFPSARILDLGGGFSVPYKPWQAPLDMSLVSAALKAFKEAHPEYALWIEPGRYFVAEAGILVSRVTQIKDKGNGVRYLGTSAGMHALIRPALYSSYHHIVNASSLARSDSGASVFNVVGPICESGDTLAYARPLCGNVQASDLIVFATAGAYGFTMSSSYNLRPISEHILP